ncbi:MULTISPECIES: sensor histidine kinase [Sphingobacterium]|uniref:sensor histidine kinase n=1 Tax=Sphingobacterium TaxID=28453 RepID=UPI00258036E8|nr:MULTISPECIES: histidine kinase [Sphingobacterium]
MKKVEEPKDTSSSQRFVPDRVKRLMLVFLAFLLYYLVSFLLDPYSVFWHEYFKRDVWELVAEWIIGFLFYFLISESSIFIHNRLNKVVPWQQSKWKRLMLEVLINFSIVFIFLFLNMIFFAIAYQNSSEFNPVPTNDEIRGALQLIIASLVISFIIIFVNTVSYLINNWVATSTEAAEQRIKLSELKQATTEAELSALKLQLDPHFIFNNLSVLSELILEDQQLGYEYSENFSKVYRYLLVNSKKNLISLDEEIKFLYAYIFLIENRVGNGVQFNISIQPHSKGLFIPPLTLQLLIENAIKHNTTNKKNPLLINLTNPEKGIIIVDNTLSSIDSPAITSTGIGLNNIIRRFKLLNKTLPKVKKSKDKFEVLIHLINYDREDNNN